tara:strand:- start:2457 stop:2654 length:198 start_codon:yes stop_codon:yes gene_type:complete
MVGGAIYEDAPETSRQLIPKISLIDTGTTNIHKNKDKKNKSNDKEKKADRDRNAHNKLGGKNHGI